MKKTKIVATLGPASASRTVAEKLIQAGVNAFRFNFSHGSHEDHRSLFEMAKSLSQELGNPITLIQDLQGPKIRVGMLHYDSVDLEDDTEITLTSQDVEEGDTRIPVVYPFLERDVRPGEIILMDDGKVRLQSVAVVEEGVRCLVLEGGILTRNKGVNFPGTALSTPALTQKDVEDLHLGMELGFDAVALSFVARGSDVEILRDEMRRQGWLRPIISKIERAACLEHLDEVVEASDAVMVARGDLGVEVDIRRLPILQKTIIRTANSHRVPVITATQMLESMTVGRLPTRAEAADVANAILDGTDALMLSGETAVGKYPVNAVQMMNDIALEAEIISSENDGAEPWRLPGVSGDEVARAICHTAVVAARDMGLKNIIAVTLSGQTALDIAAFRPKARIQAFAPDPALVNFLSLSRGVEAHCTELASDFEALTCMIDDHLVSQDRAEPGEIVAMVLGVPIRNHKATNALIIRRIGEIGAPECAGSSGLP